MARNEHKEELLRRIAELESKGVRVIGDEELEAVAGGASAEKPTVVCTRAHGVTAELSAKLSAKFVPDVLRS